MRRSSLLIPLFLVAALTAARCGDDVDVSELTAGEVVDDSATYGGLDYNITSDNYRRWLVASTALDSANVQPATRLDPRRATDDEIDRMVDALKDDERARAIIESADISVRDYVLTSVALAQSWDAVERPGRVSGIPAQNVEFLRAQEGQATEAAPPRQRPRSRIIDDSDSDSDSDSDGKGKGKGRGRGRNKG